MSIEEVADANADPPVFIVGAMRSGTTLIRLMLNRHPSLAIPAESHFLSTLFRRFGPTAVLDREELDEALSIVTTTTEWRRDWNTEAETLAREVYSHSQMRMSEFIECVFRQETRATRKPRWGSKTPAHLFQVRRLRACFPDAEIVAMVRDPRDAFLSLAPRDWVGTSPWQVGNYLRRCDQMIETFAEDGYGHFTVVRYEDLVLEPERTLKYVCEAVGLQFESSMLGFYTDAAENVQQWELDIGAHQKLMRPPSSKDVGRWRHEGSRREVREVEALTSDAIVRFGYEASVRPREIRMLRARAHARARLRNPFASVRTKLRRALRTDDTAHPSDPSQPSGISHRS